MKPKALVLGLAMAQSAAACGGQQAPESAASATGLPRYTPADSAVFDDVIAPPVFGLPNEGPPADRDPKLIERTQRAEFVLRVKIATITRDGQGNTPSYTLALRPIPPAIVGDLPEGPVEVRLDANNPSIPLLQTSEARMVGQTMIVFFRRFDDDGEARMHFRAEPDERQVMDAIQRAKILDELGG